MSDAGSYIFTDPKGEESEVAPCRGVSFKSMGDFEAAAGGFVAKPK